MKTPKSTFTEAHCNNCGRATRHRIRAKILEYKIVDPIGEQMIFPTSNAIKKFITDNYEDYKHYASGRINYTEDEYLIIECCGCVQKHFIHTHFNKSPTHPRDVDYSNDIFQEYPPRYDRPFPNWLSYLDDDLLNTLLIETYKALHAESLCLATMGIRASLERLMVMTVDDHGSFKENIGKFIEKGFLQPHLREPLVQALDAGHAAIHRGYVPKPEVLSDVFDILEGIIVSTLILPEKASAVQKITPIRRVIRGNSPRISE